MADDPAVEAGLEAWRLLFVSENPGDFPSMADTVAAIVAAIRPVLAREAFNQAAEAIEAQPAFGHPLVEGCLAHAAEMVRGLGGETQ